MINKIIGAISIAAIIVSSLAYSHKPELGRQGSTGPQGPQGERGIGVPGKDGKDGVTTVITKTAPTLGGIASPEIIYPYLVFNGNRKEWAYQRVMNTATTSPCNLQAPAATSSLMYAWADFDTSTTSAAHIQMATAATPNATTTLIAQVSVGPNVGVQLVATTTQSSQPILAPNSWVNVKIVPFAGSASQGASSPTGSCGAEFNIVSY